MFFKKSVQQAGNGTTIKITYDGSYFRASYSGGLIATGTKEYAAQRVSIFQYNSASIEPFYLDACIEWYSM